LGAQRGNIARMTALDAGWYHVPGTTVDHFCGSSILTTMMAASNVMAGVNKAAVAAGIDMASIDVPPGIVTDQGNLHLREKHPITAVGISADVIATEEGISREDADQFAYASQQRAANAMQNGYFDRSLVPIYRDDGSLALAQEEYPRPGTTLEKLASLEPVFGRFMNAPMDEHDTFGQLAKKAWPDLEINHIHHAGSSSGIVDGASSLLIAAPDFCKAHGLKPRARIVDMASVAGSPEYNLNEPVPATELVLERAGMSPSDIDLFEVNEAFAAVPIRFMRHLKLDHDKVNVNGGAIAMGHPAGATGAILIGTLLDELERRDLSTGLVTMCAAGGMAPAVILERI
ncbi:MAG: acetyl-CoA C-acyltransferase, partial [Gammaproteobacteria bacterium]|nr:acetyl-CoA C-acyltransferase [Gammaproteobacteria bacterium]